MLYWLLDKADDTTGVDSTDGADGATMFNRALLVVTAHSLFGPWILITLTEGSFSDIQPMRLP